MRLLWPIHPSVLDEILSGGEEETDPVYEKAVAMVAKTCKASISSAQRNLRSGHNRAARLVEQMKTDASSCPPQPTAIAPYCRPTAGIWIGLANTGYLKTGCLKNGFQAALGLSPILAEDNISPCYAANAC